MNSTEEFILVAIIAAVFIRVVYKFIKNPSQYLAKKVETLAATILLGNALEVGRTTLEKAKEQNVITVVISRRTLRSLLKAAELYYETIPEKTRRRIESDDETS